MGLSSTGSRSAVACALQHAEIDAPGTDCIAILMGYHAGELMQMSEVVNGPCCEKLRQGYCSQGCMGSSPGQVFRLEVGCGSAGVRERRAMVSGRLNIVGLGMCP
jgi:hypothetical protein